MSVPLPVRVALLIAGFLSVFWLPWKIALLLIFFAGLVLPPAALGIGIVADLLYYPGHGLFWGALSGLILALTAALVRYIVKTRIM